MRYILIILLLFIVNVSAQKTAATLKAAFDVNATAQATNKSIVELYYHGGDAYYNFRFGNGNLKVFQATGTFSYLDAALNHWLAYQNNAVLASSLPDDVTFTYTQTEPRDSPEYWNDEYYTWESHGDGRVSTQGFTGKTGDNTQGGGEFSLYEGHGFNWVPQMLYVMFVNPSIRTTTNGALPGATYQTQYDEILAFFQQNVWNKWESRRSTFPNDDKYMFRSRTYISSHYANIAFFLWKMTGTQKYKNFVDGWNYDPSLIPNNEPNGFRQQLRTQSYSPYGTGYIWNSNWGSLTGASDVNHSMSEFRTIANQMKHSGSYWDATDKSRFLANARWAYANSNDTFSVDWWDDTAGVDTGAPYIDNTYYGICEFGAFDETFQQELEVHDLYSESNTGSDGWKKAHFLGALTYNRAYLDGTLVYPDYDAGQEPITPPVANTAVGNLKKKANAITY